MPRIFGITLHQKQGELQTVPNQSPSDRTRATGVDPSPEFCILTSGSSPNHAKRTLKTTPATGGPPLYLTPTEVGETPTTPQYAKRTQSPPQRTHGRPKNAKRTQFTPTATRSTNPISARRHPQSTVYNRQYTIPGPNLSPPPALSFPRRRESRNPGRPQKCETNPISRTIAQLFSITQNKHFAN